MGRQEWKSFLRTLGAVFNGVADEIRDLPARMEREAETVERRLERVETAVSNLPRVLQAIEDQDRRLRETEALSHHLHELYLVWAETDDSGSSTGF